MAICITFYHSIFREAILRKIKDFLVISLHKMETPPSPFYEVPNYFFPAIFSKKNHKQIFYLTNDGFPNMVIIITLILITVIMIMMML